jgi:hypothetical protein
VDNPWRFRAGCAYLALIVEIIIVLGTAIIAQVAASQCPEIKEHNLADYQS